MLQVVVVVGHIGIISQGRQQGLVSISCRNTANSAVNSPPDYSVDMIGKVRELGYVGKYRRTETKKEIFMDSVAFAVLSFSILAACWIGETIVYSFIQ